MIFSLVNAKANLSHEMFSLGQIQVMLREPGEYQ